jgi:hypothetical protein
MYVISLSTLSLLISSLIIFSNVGDSIMKHSMAIFNRWLSIYNFTDKYNSGESCGFHPSTLQPGYKTLLVSQKHSLTFLLAEQLSTSSDCSLSLTLVSIASQHATLTAWHRLMGRSVSDVSKTEMKISQLQGCLLLCIVEADSSNLFIFKERSKLSLKKAHYSSFCHEMTFPFYPFTAQW